MYAGGRAEGVGISYINDIAIKFQRSQSSRIFILNSSTGCYSRCESSEHPSASAVQPPGLNQRYHMGTPLLLSHMHYWYVDLLLRDVDDQNWMVEFFLCSEQSLSPISLIYQCMLNVMREVKRITIYTLKFQDQLIHNSDLCQQFVQDPSQLQTRSWNQLQKQNETN